MLFFLKCKLFEIFFFSPEIVTIQPLLILKQLIINTI